MFTGIIEAEGKVENIEIEGSNINFTFSSSISHELKIDQSVSHNGVCLTVTHQNNAQYKVTAIEETMIRTNLGKFKIGDAINLERAMVQHGRLDGHIVQGHVDQTAICTDVVEEDGSWVFSFEYDTAFNNITIEKGSITVNGTSLTVVNAKKNRFSVAIIPYTYENTNFNSFKVGTKVNIEFDVVGKYVKRIRDLRK